MMPSLQTILDAWAKSSGGRAAAERAEEILEWMDRLYKGGNPDVKPDTITFNAGRFFRGDHVMSSNVFEVSQLHANVLLFSPGCLGPIRRQSRATPSRANP